MLVLIEYGHITCLVYMQQFRSCMVQSILIVIRFGHVILSCQDTNLLCNIIILDVSSVLWC